MANANRFRLWLHPVHGHGNLAPMKSEKLSRAVSVEERLSILSELATSQSRGPILQNDTCARIELFLSRGRLVARNRYSEELFALPMMFSLIACHRNDAHDAPEDLSGLAGVISCTFRSTSMTLPWESERASSVGDDFFKCSDVWLLVVTAFDKEELSGVTKLSNTRGAALGDAIAAFGRLGGICRGLRGDTLVQTSWETTCSEVGATAGVALLRECFEPQGHEEEQERPSYAVKIWNSNVSDLNILRETKSLLQVQGHPSISRFIGLFRSVTWTGVPQWLMLMEACPRGDLACVIRQRGAFSELEGLFITRDVLQALEYIHGLCIIHRDVKLENVVLRVDGIAVLVDFGLSVHLSEMHALTQKCGTPGSIAPEIMRGFGCCKKSDIFGCGIVLYGTLSASLPFTGKDVQAAADACAKANVVFPDALFAHVSSCSRRLIEKMLRRRACHRPSATEALHALEGCVAAVNSVQTYETGSPLGTGLHESCESGLHAITSEPSIALPAEVSGEDDVALDVPCTSDAPPAVSLLLDEAVASRESMIAACREHSGIDVAAPATTRWQRSFLDKMGSAVASVSQRLKVNASARDRRNVVTAFPFRLALKPEHHDTQSLRSDKRVDSSRP